jgi:hypothetical protein
VGIVVTEILNIAHLCRPKTHISEAGSASFVRWNMERGKPTVVGKVKVRFHPVAGYMGPEGE